MARNSSNGLSISQLEHILSTRRSEVRKLAKQRDRVARKLAAVDRQILALGGQVDGRSSGRPRNEQSLTEAIAAVLKGGKPMNVGVIVEGVGKLGYRSSSANFRGIVNQTLIKEKQFKQASRGMYQLAH